VSVIAVHCFESSTFVLGTSARHRVRFLSEQLDTSTPAGKLVFTVLGAVAELERSVIVEGVMAGLRNAHAKGKQFGRQKKNQLVLGIRPGSGLTFKDQRKKR
jgi:DNA invertase Pin-like site-specific DNA recombinase